MDQELIHSLTTFGSVALGGVLAMLGGFFGSLWNHNLTLRREERGLRRERILRIIECLLETEKAMSEWALYVGSLGVYSATGKPAPDQTHRFNDRYDEALAIQRLYFPDLLTAMVVVRQAKVAHNNFVGHHLELIASDARKWLVEEKPSYGSGSGAALQRYQESLHALIETIRLKQPEYRAARG